MANLLEETNIGLCTVGGQVKLKVYQGTKVHVQLRGLAFAFVRAKEDKKQTNKQTNKQKQKQKQ